MATTRHNLTPFLLLCLIGFAAFFSSYLRFPVMPLFAATLGAGPAQVGIINGAFMLTAGLLSIPAGLLADRFGRRKLIIAGLAATAFSALLVTVCRLPGEMVLAYVLFGIGMAAFAPGMLSLVADVMPVQQLGLAYGWYTTAIYTAMTVGPASGGVLARGFGLRQVFLISGGLQLAVVLLALLLLPQGPPRHKTDIRSALSGSIILLRNQRLIACLLATVVSCIGFGVFVTFLPLYASGLGYDAAKVGLVFAAQAVTNVVGRVPIGRLADRFDRRWLVSGGLICLAAALMALGRVVDLPRILACSAVIGVGMALSFTAIGAMIAELVPPLQRGLSMGMYNSCIYLGMMCGSTVMGLALQRIGYSIGFAVSGGVALVALALFLAMFRELPTTSP